MPETAVSALHTVRPAAMSRVRTQVSASRPIGRPTAAYIERERGAYQPELRVVQAELLADRLAEHAG